MTELIVDTTTEKIVKSLKYSIKDGIFWSLMTGFGESYLYAFAIFLNATPIQMSLLAAIPQLMSSIFGLSATKLTTIFNSRKKIILWACALQAFIWPTIILVSILTKNVWILLLMASLYFTFGAMAQPAWASMMGDLVPFSKRGNYFGKRNRIIGFSSFISVIIAGLILDKVSMTNGLLAFFILFAVAFIGRSISVIYLSKHHDPDVEVREPKYTSFFAFLKKINTNNFGIFSLFTMLMHFAVYIASPLFIVYWLDYLGFSYFQYMVLMSVAQIASFITMSYWGVHADYYGNKVVLSVSSYMISLIPLIWYLTILTNLKITFIIGIIVQSLSGFAWAGFNLSSSNFIYDSVDSKDRVTYFSYYNALKGSSIFLGAALGGLLTKFILPKLSWLPSTLFMIMLLSFILRFIVTHIFIKKIQDVKIVDKKPQFLYFATVMPFQGIIFDSIVGMNRTIKKFKERLLKIEGKLDYMELDLKKKTKNE